MGFEHMLDPSQAEEKTVHMRKIQGLTGYNYANMVTSFLSLCSYLDFGCRFYLMMRLLIT